MEVLERELISGGHAHFLEKMIEGKAILGMILFVTISRNVDTALVTATAVNEVVTTVHDITRDKEASPTLEDHEAIKEALDLSDELDLTCLYEGYESRSNAYCLRVVRK